MRPLEVKVVSGGTGKSTQLWVRERCQLGEAPEHRIYPAGKWLPLPARSIDLHIDAEGVAWADIRVHTAHVDIQGVEVRNIFDGGGEDGEAGDDDDH